MAKKRTLEIVAKLDLPDYFIPIVERMPRREFGELVKQMLKDGKYILVHGKNIPPKHIPRLVKTSEADWRTKRKAREDKFTPEVFNELGKTIVIARSMLLKKIARKIGGYHYDEERHAKLDDLIRQDKIFEYVGEKNIRGRKGAIYLSLIRPSEMPNGYAIK